MIPLLASPFVTADIIFAGRPMGPSSNIYALNPQGELIKHTHDSRWRDLMAHVADDGRIVFASDRTSSSGIDLSKNAAGLDLYMLHPASASVTRLTHSPALEAHPKFSPDGRHLAYVADKGDLSELRLRSRSSGETRTLASADEIYDLSWSPSGERIAYALRDDASSALKAIGFSAAGSPSEPETLVRLSADAAPASIAATNRQQSPPDLKKLVASVAWSPNGQHIAYIVHSLFEPERVLHIYDVASGKHRPVSPAKVQVQQPVSWAADGKKLLYAALVDYAFYYHTEKHEKVYQGGMQLFISDLQAGSEQLTQGDHLHKNPVFSPDGSRIAFLYGNALDSRSLTVRTVSADGTNERDHYVGAAPDSFLYWTDPASPDGRELAMPDP